MYEKKEEEEERKRASKLCQELEMNLTYFVAEIRSPSELASLARRKRQAYKGLLMIIDYK